MRLPRLLSDLASPMRYFRPSRMRETGARIYGGGFGDDPHLAARFAAARAPDPLGYYGQILAGADWTSAHYLSRLRQPVLLAGDDDPIIPLVNARLMAALLCHPHPAHRPRRRASRAAHPRRRARSPHPPLPRPAAVTRLADGPTRGT